jgi:hypothetical protein
MPIRFVTSEKKNQNFPEVVTILDFFSTQNVKFVEESDHSKNIQTKVPLNILVVFRVIYNVNLNHRGLCKILAFHGSHIGFTIHIKHVNFA